jgi:hypothetical protein
LSSTRFKGIKQFQFGGETFAAFNLLPASGLSPCIVTFFQPLDNLGMLAGAIVYFADVVGQICQKQPIGRR